MTLKERLTTRCCLASGGRSQCNPVTFGTIFRPFRNYFFVVLRLKENQAQSLKTVSKTVYIFSVRVASSVTGECQSLYRKVFALHGRLQSVICRHMLANMHEHVNGVRPCDGIKAVVRSYVSP